ncbi:hypothetical protein EV363DRAFT_637378 [Boletus edulis]|nr:hypothetical protein EV363DRAFT_637378 [Boletus edulis]
MPNDPEAQHRMDQELTRLMTQVCDVRRQRNMLSPISRLPEEILAEIFTHGARDHHEHYRLPVDVSYLVGASQRWTEELLARSKQTSLKISLLVRRSTEEQSVVFFKKMAACAERIQELRIKVIDRPPEVFAHLLESSACTPHLRVLEVEGYHGLHFFVMLRILNGNTPALSKLKLQDIDLPWFLFQLSGLASLSLKYIPPPSHSSMVDFLSTLSRMQNIVHLCLVEALPSACDFLSSADFDTSQKINLPHLSRLLIVAPLSTVVAFLSCVKIPGTTKMKLRCKQEKAIPRDDFGPYSALFTLLERRFKSCEDCATLSPTIRAVSARYDEFVLSTSASEHDYFSAPPPRSHDEELWDCNIPLRLEFDGPWELLDDVCLCVSPTGVQRAQIHNFYPPTSWENILRHFQELRYLKVTHGRWNSDLVSALSLVSPNHITMESQDVYDGQGLHLLCARGLEELELADMFWGVDPYSLRAALLTRKECGCSLKRLVINNCSIHDLRDPMDVWNLPVGEVCWDGKSKHKYM